jgi:hypothetical protein
MTAAVCPDAARRASSGRRCSPMASASSWARCPAVRCSAGIERPCPWRCSAGITAAVALLAMAGASRSSSRAGAARWACPWRCSPMTATVPLALLGGRSPKCSTRSRASARSAARRASSGRVSARRAGRRGRALRPPGARRDARCSRRGPGARRSPRPWHCSAGRSWAARPVLDEIEGIGPELGGPCSIGARRGPGARRCPALRAGRGVRPCAARRASSGRAPGAARRASPRPWRCSRWPALPGARPGARRDRGHRWPERCSAASSVPLAQVLEDAAAVALLAAPTWPGARRGAARRWPAGRGRAARRDTGQVPGPRHVRELGNRSPLVPMPRGWAPVPGRGNRWEPEPLRAAGAGRRASPRPSRSRCSCAWRGRQCSYRPHRAAVSPGARAVALLGGLAQGLDGPGGPGAVVEIERSPMASASSRFPVPGAVAVELGRSFPALGGRARARRCAAVCPGVVEGRSALAGSRAPGGMHLHYCVHVPTVPGATPRPHPAARRKSRASSGRSFAGVVEVAQVLAHQVVASASARDLVLIWGLAPPTEVVSLALLADGAALGAGPWPWAKKKPRAGTRGRAVGSVALAVSRGRSCA